MDSFKSLSAMDLDWLRETREALSLALSMGSAGPGSEAQARFLSQLYGKQAAEAETLAISTTGDTREKHKWRGQNLIRLSAEVAGYANGIELDRYLGTEPTVPKNLLLLHSAFENDLPIVIKDFEAIEGAKGALMDRTITGVRGCRLWEGGGSCVCCAGTGGGPTV